MKSIGMLLLVASVSGWITSSGQGMEAEVPGDNFSLEGALELFKKSSSPEEFEKLLNSPDSKVNNLDFNGDGYIDYIRVHDRYEGNVHAFILQAVVSDSEYQDVAVIELEKLANGKAVLQIIGDADVYGIETIIEPTREVRTYAGTTTTRAVVNVWAWPSVQYVYGPYYRGWESPWGWYRRPVWYRTWRPIAYVHYYPVWRPYYHYYVPCHTRRVVYAHRIYSPYRRTSVVYHTRHRDQLSRYRSTYRDSDRNARTRSDDRMRTGDRRSYDRGDVQRGRDDSNLDRRSTPQRERVASPARSVSRDRSGANQQREGAWAAPESATRRSTAPATRELRRESPEAAINRPRSYESTPVQRPSPTRQSVSTDRQRMPAAVERHQAPRPAPADVQRTRPTPRQAAPASVNRSRSSAGQSVQRTPARSGGTRTIETKRGRQ